MYIRGVGWVRRAARSLRRVIVGTSGVRIEDAARMFGGPANYSGVTVNEQVALGLSAFFRAVALVAGTIGTLPMPTLRDPGTGQVQRMTSWLDEPGGPDGPTPFSWKETVVAHLMCHGDAFLRHIYGGAGQLLALEPIHPLSVQVRWWRKGDAREPRGGKWYTLQAADGPVVLDADGMTQIMGLSLDGLRGLSVIAQARNSLGTAVAGDRAAAATFNNGAAMAGFVTPTDDELDPDEEDNLRDELNRAAVGYDNAGKIVYLNRKLQFTPYTMSLEDAQFMQSRAFQIEEIARWTGVPPHLLMQTEKQTSWGQGVEQQNLGLGRFTLNPWTCRIEQRLSRLLPRPRYVEFDYAGLERPSPQDELQMIINEFQAGIITRDEARAKRNLPPLGDNQPADQPAPDGETADA
jgi:HK97 family phage portal protein